MNNKIMHYIENIQKNNTFFKIFSGNFITVEINLDSKSKKKIQTYSGIVISVKNKGICSSITIRRISNNNEGIEQTFFIYSKNIKNIILNKKIKVRKSKLYFLRKNKYIKLKK